MEKSKQKRKKTIIFKNIKRKAEKQRFFSEVLTECESFFSPADLDFFIKYVMIKKSYLSTHRIFNSQIFKPNNLALEQEGEFQLRPINPMLFLLNRQNQFIQHSKMKFEIEKQNNKRLIATPVVKRQKPSEIQNFNLFSLDKRMREKKKHIKAQFKVVQSTIHKKKQPLIPQYCFSRRKIERKFNRTHGNESENKKATRRESLSNLRGSQIPFQFLRNLYLSKQLKNNKIL